MVKWFNVKSGYGFINRYVFFILIKLKDQFVICVFGVSKDLQVCFSDKGCVCFDSCLSFFYYNNNVYNDEFCIFFIYNNFLIFGNKEFIF